MTIKRVEFVVTKECTGRTLRLFLGDVLPLEPENVVRQLIIARRATVNGETSDPKRVLREGEVVAVEQIEETRKEFGQDIVRAPAIYEDADLLVLNKPAGCTVVRERSSEICPFQNGVLELLRKSPAADALAAAQYRPRAVHRLDRDTTGAIIFAKTRTGELHLFPQFQNRTVEKEYLAVLHGEVLKDTDTIEASVAETPNDLERMAIDSHRGKSATTHYEVIERFRGFTYVRAMPHTGRRHQLRLHFAHIGHPIVADRIYGGGTNLMLSSIKRGYRRRHKEAPETPLIARPALHAFAIRFLPPGIADAVRVEAPLPRDMEVLLKMLRKWAVGGFRAATANYPDDDY